MKLVEILSVFLADKILDVFKRRKPIRPRAQLPLRIAIIEPVWTHYRYPVYRELALHCHVDWLFSPVKPDAGFGTVVPSITTALRYIEVPMRTPLGKAVAFWQSGVTSYLVRERPAVVMCSADPRSASFWMALIASRLLRIPAFVHGHGVFGKTEISSSYRRMMSYLLHISAGYIAYGPVVRDGLAQHGFPIEKVHIAHNSVPNRRPLTPEEKTGTEDGLLFIGRLRADSAIEMLLSAMQRVRQRGYDIGLHIVGGGQELLRLQERYSGESWVHWYGEVYEADRIRDISRNCFAGCYPGPAGLSVVHMMSLSLPVILQHGLEHHGPEVAIVRDGENGVCYSDRQDLAGAIVTMVQNPAVVKAMQGTAYRTYLDVTTPSLATQLGQILLRGAWRRAAAEFHSVPILSVPSAPLHAGDAAEKLSL